MSAPFRLDAPYGLLLDRSRTLHFTFDGHRYEASAGDTIASALAAQGEYLISRSFKYHRPRGPVTFAGMDANAMVQVAEEPNVRADQRPVTDGLVVDAQNVEGSLRHDRGQWIERISRFLPAGFYYKAFFRPRGIWESFWEPIVRKRAGLGRVSTRTPRRVRDKDHAFTDVLVIGGGLAGLSAAREAGRAGARVLVVEEAAYLGGALGYERGGDASIEAQRQELLAEIEALPNVETWTDAPALGWYADHWVPVSRGGIVTKTRARQTIIAVGALEQPAVFRNNDLPGIILGTAAQRLIHLYGVAPGRRAVVYGDGPEPVRVARDLRAAGIEVAALVCLGAASPGWDGPVYENHVIREAFADADGRIAALTIQPQGGGGLVRLACDVLAVSVGRIPSWRLPLQAGGKLTVQGEGREFAIGNLPDGVHLCGAVSGRGTLAAAMADGAHAGRTAAARLGFGVASGAAPAPTARPIPDSFIQPHPKGRDFVDLDEDLQTKDLLGAVADGYSELELVKRFSTVGMGPTQGRHSAFPTAQIVAEATGRRLAQVGVTTARSPVVPVSLEALAGRAFDPERLSPMDALHRASGAQMMPTGAWWRPAYYGKPEDRTAAIAAEVRAIRNDVGIIDVATLGKLELRGPDSAAFLERFYTGKFTTQKAGKIRYLLALADTGAIIDDGVALKLADDLFYLTTTTGAADRIYRSMLWWNTQWRMDIDIASFTSANASLNLAGPRARELMAGLRPSFAIDAATLPYMSGVEGTLDGVPAKVMRIGFVGELGYEIHVPAGYGAWLWRRLAEAGARPVGTEAQRVLRLEKGHIIVGQDTDAVCDPEEAAMMWAVGKNKGDFIGARSLALLARRRPQRRRLVGFRVTSPGTEAPPDPSLILVGDEIVGNTTSAVWSETLQAIVGLALVPQAMAALGTELTIKSDHGLLAAEVVKTPFYDPEGARQAL